MKSPGLVLTLRVLLLAQLRQQPARLIIMLSVIALGVALGTSVFLVNATALDEFTAATQKLVGDADLIVRGSAGGFAESLYPALATDPRVRIASPVLEVMAALPRRRTPLRIIGLDVFRAAALQPALLADLSGDVRRLFAPAGLFLSQSAAAELGLHAGESLTVSVGNEHRSLQVLGVLSGESYPQAVGLMDIASAQLSFGRLGVIDRIDLRLQSGVRASDFAASLSPRLPAGVVAVEPDVERGRAATVTKGYRVNLNMLALVALLTAAFLVYSIQSLAMLRRRAAIALLRALGVTRRQLQAALLAEGLVVGALASCLGVAGGWLLASLVVRWLQGDFGNGQIHLSSALPHVHPLALVFALLVGTSFACAATFMPARTAARRDPARGLKAGDAADTPPVRRWMPAGSILLLLGGALLLAPPLYGLPIAGYAAVALLLFGAVLWVPAYTDLALRLLPPTSRPPWRIALGQLRGSGQAIFLSLAPIIVSFAFMVSMTIMVHSFRQSFVFWLDKLLPADIQVRLPYGSDTAVWDGQAQRAAAATPGIARAQFRRTRSLLLRADREPVTLIARDMQWAPPDRILPLVASLSAQPRDAAWISEALADKFGLRLGESMTLPLGGRTQRFTVAGIWRDYARTEGAVVISRARYIELSGDTGANEGSIWLTPQADAAAVEQALRTHLGAGGALEVLTSGEVKRRSLRIFDRAFAVTYGLEILAVLIALAGISVAASFAAIARRAEFGMLRHVGMLKRQVVGMLAAEGIATAAMGAAYGLALGLLLSLVLVFIINRQSFNWSIDLVIPYGLLGLLAAALVIASAATATLSGRSALSEDALRAVREDW